VASGWHVSDCRLLALRRLHAGSSYICALADIVAHTASATDLIQVRTSRLLRPVGIIAGAGKMPGAAGNGSNMSREEILADQAESHFMQNSIVV
jgi:hypothetical protein